MLLTFDTSFISGFLTPGSSPQSEAARLDYNALLPGQQEINKSGPLEK